MKMTRLMGIGLGCILSCSPLGAQILLSEDFAGGLPDGWSTVVFLGNDEAAAAWQWTDEGAMGPIADISPPLASPTAGNGWMIFDSDLACNTPAGQDSWLISPPIATEGAEEIWLHFATLHASYNDQPFLRIGADLNNPAIWPAVEVFPDLQANQYGDGSIINAQATPAENPQVLYFDLTEYAVGLDTFYLAFQFLSTAATLNGGEVDFIGCGYSWQVDDVILSAADPRPPHSMRINDFFAIAPNAVTPAACVEPMGFLADIANLGALPQTDVQLRIEIEDGSGAVVFADSLTYAQIGVDSTAENVPFPNTFTPTPSPGLYTGAYTLAYENAADDAFPDDNQRAFSFRVSDTLFAKELGATTALAPQEELDYAYGNVYYVPEGTSLYARYISFAVENADELAGVSVNLITLAWEGDANGNFFADPAEYTLATFNEYTFSGDEGVGLIHVPASVDEPLLLQGGTHYIVLVQYSALSGETLFLQASEAFDYLAMNFLTEEELSPRYAAALDIGLTGAYDLFGFGMDVVPLIRLSVGADPIVSDMERVPLPASAARLAPNPARGTATLHLDFPTALDAQLRLRDGQGRSLWQRELKAVQATTVELPVHGLPAGAYQVNIRTKAGAKTLRLLLVD